jgi:8-oxo-dGTP pyrophosphatase MutT (NUDIX family)
VSPRPGAGQAEGEFFDRLEAVLKAAPAASLETGALELKEAAVLAPVFWRGGEPWAWATRRPQTLRQHPGQISFPGGGRDEGDLTLLHTALRETEEELGIPRDAVRVLGMLGGVPVPTGFYVTPFVGAVSCEQVLKPSAAEIAEVLEVPLLRMSAVRKVFFEAERDAWAWEGSDHVIWGATHRMIRQLLESVRAAAGAA